MPAAGRHDDHLSTRQCDMRVLNPHVRLPVADAQDFLDCMQMSRRAMSRLAPLLEHTELRRTIGRRRFHARHDARPPFLARLLLQIDDTHPLPKTLRRGKQPSLPAYTLKTWIAGTSPAMTRSGFAKHPARNRIELLDQLRVARLRRGNQRGVERAIRPDGARLV